MVMDGMAVLKEFVSFCQQNQLLPSGSSVVAACSGGPDSLALVDILWRLRETWQLRICVAHFEHGIRGEDSRQDAAFVAAFCREHGLEFVQEAAAVPDWAASHGQSLETAARNLRYAFLHRQRERLGPGAVIAIAHHGDDQAETVLQHLLRGSGLDGLSGMRPQAGRIIRPLLFTTKAVLEEYCRQRGLTPRHDATNDLPDCTRNRLRLELLPRLAREYNPGVRSALCRLAELAAADCDYLDGQAAHLLREMARPESGGWSLDRGAFRDLPLAMARRVLRQLVQQLQGSCQGWEARHFEQLREFLLTGESGRRLSLPGTFQAELVYGTVHFHKPLQPTAAAAAMPLQIPGQTRLEFFRCVVQAEIRSELPRDVGREAMYCDYDRLPGPVRVRSRRAGDRLRLAGGTKKLKDFFIDRKLPREARDRVPVFCAGEEILWLGGWRRTTVAAVRPDTKRYLFLQLKNI